ncbi:unnamed protein product [Polarella glacialis]|uniref:RING-type domain-containing protein n=1 Tax=Polarella glacialis TaxID=89957 RepID=A0A813EWK1_POLGL|nr:unnamed protein product [Polarella glacialis]
MSGASGAEQPGQMEVLWTLAALLFLFTSITVISMLICLHYDYGSYEPRIPRRPASQSTGKFTLAELAETTFPEVGVLDELPCTICLDVIAPEDPARKLSCSHAFHSSCISCWWKCSLQSGNGKVSCPSCRNDLEVCIRAAREQAEQQLQLSTASAASPPLDQEEGRQQQQPRELGPGWSVGSWFWGLLRPASYVPAA